MIPLTTGQVLELDVTDLAYGGAGVSRHVGFVVFVAGALPGERVRARIEATKSTFAEGVAIEILEPSPRRVAAPCAYFGSCGGCQWMNLEYAAQLEAKQGQVRDCLERIGGLRDFRLHPIAPSPQTLAYRNKVEFAFAPREGGLVLGLHRADDPAATVEIGECLLQAPEANELLRFIAAACRELRLEADPLSRPESESGEEGTAADRPAGRASAEEGRERAEEGSTRAEEGRGADRPAAPREPERARMRRLVLRRGGDGRYLVIFATSAGSFPEGAILGARLTERFSTVSGVARLVGDSRSRNERATTLAGSGLLADESAGLRLTTGAASFLQVNSAQAAALYRKVEEFAAASPGERVLDLYCGAGAITLLLARHAGGATGVESSEEAVRSAERNARDNGLTGCRFVRGDARRVLASMVYDGQKQDLVIVNPPRAGIAKEVAGSLARLTPSRIVYVSCNPATLARDLARLARLGYRTTDIAPFDMFPHTWHIETVARLEGPAPIPA